MQEVLGELPEARAERERQAAEAARLTGRSPAPFAPAPEPAAPVPLETLAVPGAAVEHIVFGLGVVTGWDGRFLTVRFRDGRPRRLDGATVAAHRLLWRWRGSHNHKTPGPPRCIMADAVLVLVARGRCV